MDYRVPCKASFRITNANIEVGHTHTHTHTPAKANTISKA
jgi:hypothetical protein